MILATTHLTDLAFNVLTLFVDAKYGHLHTHMYLPNSPLEKARQRCGLETHLLTSDYFGCAHLHLDQWNLGAYLWHYVGLMTQLRLNWWQIMMTIIMTTGHSDDFVVKLKQNNKILVFSPNEEARKRNALQKVTVNIVLLYLLICEMLRVRHRGVLRLLSSSSDIPEIWWLWWAHELRDACTWCHQLAAAHRWPTVPDEFLDVWYFYLRARLLFIPH